MAAHERTGLTDEWYTPEWLFDALGVWFDCDAASPGHKIVPWIPAVHHITQGSLYRAWGTGPVWLNPPYGGRNGIRPWLEKLADHGNGIALVPNRTATDWWQNAASRAEGLLFVHHKIRFIRPDGSQGMSPGYGNVLMAFGGRMADRLVRCDIDGWRGQRYEKR